jgi:glucosyl-3-phosphoglycerate synthase
LRAMKAVLGQHPLLDYLDSFRYPLAGEISITTDLARINRIPSDWGLEIGTLVEVYRNCSQKRICQVELTENYDHRHQDLSEHDATRGLHRMVRDIASSAIRNLASYGVQFDSGFLNTLTAAYRRTAQDAIASYNDDAALNGLVFDRHEEEFAVETFSGALRARPASTSCAIRWKSRRSRTGTASPSALPDFLDELREAVEQDAAES